jgi:hypothetical protein
MTLRPEYALGHSPYNAFLFATVGEEQAAVPLSVLSALTRLGFDPWQEAARLSDLPREAAARALAITMAMLPEGDWKASEAEATADRLVSQLPHQSMQAIPPAKARRIGDNEIKPSFAAVLAWGVLAVVLLFFAVALFSTNTLAFGNGTTMSTQP